MKALLGNVLLAALAVLFTLVAAELVLKLVRPINMNQKAVAMRYDPLLGWSKVPNLRGTYVPGDDTVETFNSRGLRGPEYPYAKPPDEYRILVLGDSFAEGRLVAFEDMASEVLGRRLNATSSAPRYEVISAGSGGYSTDQALLFFMTEGRKYAPDLTVLMLYENDVWYNAQPKAWRGFKPFFRLEGDELVLSGVPVPRKGVRFDRAGGSPSRLPSVARRLESWVSARSALYQFLGEAVAGLPPAGRLLGVGVAPAASTAAAPGSTPVPDEFRVWRRTYDRDVRRAWRVTEALLRELQRQTREIGSELVVLYVPTAAEIHPQRWEATKQKYGLSEDGWDITRLERELAARCRRNAIHFVNPAPAFRAAAARSWFARTPLYFELDPHWTPEGHRLAADVLVEYLRRHIFTSRASRPAGRGRGIT